MSCRECHLSCESQIRKIFSICIILTCNNMRVIDVVEEAARFESECESLYFADFRGEANIHWNHSEVCKAARISDRPDCRCSRAIFSTSQHLELYEQNLRQTEVEPDERAVTSTTLKP